MIRWMNSGAGWPVCTLALLIAIGVAPLLVAQEQRNQPAPKRGESIGARVENGVEIVVPKVDRQPVQRRGKPAAWQRPAKRMTAISSELAEQSFDAFRRGLLPLEDHLEHLDAVLDAELAVVTDPKDVPRGYERHAERLGQIIEPLEAFRQPGAIGWKADVLLARAMHAQAEQWLADARGKKQDAAQSASEALQFAEQHLEQRILDFQEGQATVPMIVNGSLILVRLSQQIEFVPPDPATFLSDAVVFTRLWSRQGAGIGRDDRLALAEFQQAEFEVFDSLAQKDRRELPQQIAQAQAAAERLFDAQWAFAQRGTATLFDLAQSWRLRGRFHDILQANQIPIGNDQVKRHAADLERLVAMSQEVTDLRGRNAADVNFASLLAADAEFRQAIAAEVKNQQ